MHERVNDCLESKAAAVRVLEDEKYNCSFVPATNERSKSILKLRDQRLEIEKTLEEDVKQRVQKKALEISLPGFTNRPEEQIYFGKDKSPQNEAWRKHHKKEDYKKYPHGVTEELIKKNFKRYVSKVGSRSQSMR